MLAPPPPPPPLPMLQALSPSSSSSSSSAAAATAASAASGGSSSSYNPSLIIIVAILVAASLVTAAIVFLLRHLSRGPPSPSSSSSSYSRPLARHVNSSILPSSATFGRDQLRPVVVDSLPLVSFAAVTTTGSSKFSSSDCAVCLSRFRAGDQLRLLPACLHAFHTPCIDAWLRSPAASCPLCRSPIHIPPPASPVQSPPSSPPPHSPGALPSPPGDEVAASAGGDERGWLKEYVDRLATSASSSLSSFRLSDRWSWRFEESRRRSLDLEEGGGAAAEAGGRR